MRFSKSWIVAKKDFSVFRKNKYVFYSLIGMPLLLGIIVPLALLFAIPIGQVPLSEILMVLNLATMYFVIIAAVLPTVIASYSFVGEKLEKSLEPLLATPTTDGELLFGKSLSAFVPCMAATYIGAAIFVVIVDTWSYTNLGTFLLPSLDWALTMGAIAPLACILSVESNIIISSRVNDVRAAQQLGGLVILPLILTLALGSTIQFISPTLLSLIIIGCLAIADIALFYLSKAVFQREEILTKWK
jgi:ABC-2 type transport system permease protein